MNHLAQDLLHELEKTMTHTPHTCTATGYAVLRPCKQHGSCQVDVMEWSCGKRTASQHGKPCPLPRKDTK